EGESVSSFTSPSTMPLHSVLPSSPSSTTSLPLPLSPPSPSLLPSSSPSPPPPFLLPTTPSSVPTTRVYGIECPLNERPLLDRITGRPSLCADTVPCPPPYQCRPYNIMLSICCIRLQPSPQPGFPPQSVIQLPSAPFPTSIPFLPQPTSSIPVPSPSDGYSSLPSPSHSLPPHPFVPPSLPTSPYNPDRTRVVRLGEDGQCGDGMVPFSTDGQIHSCLHAHCPPKYKCLNEVCCPAKHLACREPLFQGTECRDQRLSHSSTRFFFDLRSNECRPFEFRGCNPGANHFLNLRDCERSCEEEGEETEGKKRGGQGGGRGEADRRSSLCPPPYVNPKETPTICSPFFDSCPGNQKCLPSPSSHYICCATPSSTSLRSLIARMCGDGYKPVMSSSGDPRRCDPSRLPCSRRDECRFSTVLMIDICCQSEEISDNFDSGENESRRGRPTGRIYPRLPPLRSGGGFPQLQWRDAVDDSIRLCGVGEERRDCLSILFPGQSGCLSDVHCLGLSVCMEGRCFCGSPYLLFRSLCVLNCPRLFHNVRGICLPRIPSY
ncbi:hypothetical protein PMAYCL1PPCAC_12633, partial [Pristionchus mayeri]